MEDRRADADEAGADHQNLEAVGKGKRDEAGAGGQHGDGQENGMGQRSVTMPTTGCSNDAVT